MSHHFLYCDEIHDVSSFHWTLFPPQALDTYNSTKEKKVKKAYLIMLC